MLVPPNPYKELSKEWYRHECQDLWFFEKAVLAEAWPDQYHDLGKINREMCDFLTNPETTRKYLSAFRTSFKTTVLKGFMVFMFVHSYVTGQPMKLIYNTAVIDNATNCYEDIKYNLLENKALFDIYPELPRTENEYKRRGGKVSAKRIRLGHSIIDFASTDKVLVTRHYPIWINDDMENDKNTASELVRAKLMRDWRYQKAVLSKQSRTLQGIEIEIGTPYHFDGLIWSIRENPLYDRLEIPCWTERRENGKLIRESTLPEYYTLEDFYIKRQQMVDKSLFAAQFLLTPIDEEDALCRPMWVKRWKELPKNRYRTLVVDPGGSDPKVSDATAVTVVDWDINFNMYVVHAEEYFLTPGELINKLHEWRNTFGPDELRIEKEKYSVTIADIFRHRFPYMNIQFVEHGNRNKGSRIWKLRQWFESKRILFGPNQDDLELAALRYRGEGSLKRDDILDSLAYHLDIRKPPKIMEPHTLPSGQEFEPEIQVEFAKEMDSVIQAEEKKLEKEAEYYDANY